MAAVITPSIDEDIMQEVTEEERAWQEERPAQEQVPQPQSLVIFGATGDLSHRKLFPALCHLSCDRLLPEKFAIIGFGRSELSNEEFRQGLRQSLNESGDLVCEDDWERFASRISYARGHYDDVASFKRLAQQLDRLDGEEGTENHRLFYLATPPAVYADVVRNLGAAGLNRPTHPDGWARLIVEKPFGNDLETARRLDRCIHEVFDESQVYRIDHYLGKETVQNIFVLRFVNGIFEPLWNRNYVDHVQITVAESLGVEGRGGYYEHAGAVRDMLQSHLLQLLTLIAMEPPSEFTAGKVHDEKVKVLDSIRVPDRRNPTRWAVRGQYAAGSLDHHEVPGYREEEGVSPTSTTETYIGVKLMIDNWRWNRVPFYLRTGKRMAKRVSEVAIQFRRAPHVYLPGASGRVPRHNVLVLRIQPDDGMALRLDIKVPGPGLHVRPVDMSFLYRDAFGGSSPDAYQRLLLDAMRGDSTLFTRTDEVEDAWSLVTPLLHCWDGQPIPTYPAGSWGPAEARELLSADGHRWRTP